MRKVIIIGCPGSGKSTFAIKLSAVTSIPLFHLDMLYWNADKTTVEKSVFLERLNSVLSLDSWIIDGNYASTMEIRIQNCDTVFFLDYPTDICIDGITQRRGKARVDMPWVENGSEDEEFVSFVRKYNTESRPAVIALLEKYHDKDIHIFTSREEADEYLSHE